MQATEDSILFCLSRASALHVDATPYVDATGSEQATDRELGELVGLCPTVPCLAVGRDRVRAEEIPLDPCEPGLLAAAPPKHALEKTRDHL